MEAASYTPKQLSRALGVSVASVQGALKKPRYSSEDLWALRSKLARKPPPIGNRKQLFLNFKGGTGKTSLSTSFDLDSQGHATKCLGYEGEDFAKTLLDVLIRKTPLPEVIHETPLPNLRFIPSNLSMSTIDLSLMPLAAREFKLRNALREIDGQYDLTIFDAPPSFGLLNLNALMATDDLLVPVLADFLSFHGLKLLFETVQSLEEDLGHILDHVFIVVNAFNASFKLAKEALEALREHYPEYLLPQLVRQCTKFAQASSEGVPVFVADRDCKGAKDIQALIDEVFSRLVTVKLNKDAKRAG